MNERILNLRPYFVIGGINALLLLLTVIGYSWFAQGQAQSLNDFGQAPTFTLTDQLERPVTSEEFRGKVVIANFIYTHCLDICPLLSAQMKNLQDRLREEQLLGGQAQLLSFTVDPARDTPAVLRAYAAGYQADPLAWRFLTGPPEILTPLIVAGFHLGVEALPPPTASVHEHSGAPSYEVMHSGRFVLIDRQGRIRAYYDSQDFDPERIVSDIRALLEE